MDSRLKIIRETQMNLRKIPNVDSWMELYFEKTGQSNNKTTLWYWEKSETDSQYRTADIRYLKFLCTEFNYNPFFILELVDTPEFIESIESLERRFPEINKMLECLAKHPTIAMTYRDMVTQTDPEFLKRIHLECFGYHPELYEELKAIVDVFEKRPQLFQSDGT